VDAGRLGGRLELADVPPTDELDQGQPARNPESTDHAHFKNTERLIMYLLIATIINFLIILLNLDLR
jgi:hypothetical protein